ncbi:MAG: DUF721 domain-containing protein [Dongiaceae bacterium]
MPTDPDSRTNAMLSLAATLPRVTRKTLGRHGLAEGGLITDWAAIVGPMIAERSLPLRLSFAGGERNDGTLHVRVAGALALELQHLAPQIIERINGYFGYRAVARLRIHQGPVPVERGARPAPTPPVAPETDAEIGLLVDTVEDDGLRQALRTLGRSLHGAATRRRR